MSTARPPVVIGLTGGIGSGKSAAASRFASHGIVVVDTDLIAHALTGPDGEAIARIAEVFGAEMIAPDRRLDRTRMRSLVFAEPAARKRLEHILHPMIRAESERQCASASSPYVILAVPLLIESGTYRERCSRVCVVDCPESVQIERVRARSGLGEDEVRAIMATQAKRAARLAAADDVIDNSGTLKALDTQVDALHASYLALAR
ncbi:MAG: dephospho-CoA kinase [Betaproteobacteria bacterium HGW-Betaproteobacteria-13]|jgi:dephospho-CoA kinase|uniref:Dephospho-CoA kinase n=1 Tax=Parazoarcus communis TaxID=41977 RepID=A0A2U8H0H3_9RHOO|nr:dephospho-CoA kinase [Parazoarcus communis]AWI78676.1 dephospho-CoA kinase [Parazoarcus communis]PKO56556.1 MAG: dephospho-CoA kinase [Betaproteobacteria bacterium HGW-Betaproteobacteria-19]PKO81039.1 MAG: dephospho-CoA kinase [Betaproteobacteria bacterium HGW-Betaproteobacteria-13]